MSEPEEMQKRIDTLDMIIAVLQRHEEDLDKLCDKLDTLINAITTIKREEEVPPAKGATLIVKVLSEWDAYREKVQSPSFIAYDITSHFNVYSEAGGTVYRYMEPLFAEAEEIFRLKKAAEEAQPAPTQIQLKCGLSFPLEESRSINSEGKLHATTHVTIDTKVVKSWLSQQLNVSESRVHKGRIEI